MAREEGIQMIPSESPKGEEVVKLNRVQDKEELKQGDTADHKYGFALWFIGVNRISAHLYAGHTQTHEYEH